MSVAQRTLRGLIGQYLARPDPLAWLAAADLYDETCDRGLSCGCKDCPCRCATIASIWRARGKYYRDVLGGYENAKRMQAGSVLLGSVLVSYALCVKTVSVSVRLRSLCASGGNYLWLIVYSDPRDLTRRVIQLIDDIRSHLEEAPS